MIAAVCAVLTGGAFYLSIGLGTQWALAWLAPVPVLWLAFGGGRAWPVFVAAFGGFALGQANVLQAYAGELPLAVTLLAIAVPSLAFAVAVAGGRSAYHRLGSLAGLAAFAFLWAGLDFAISWDKAGGSVMTPAASQLDAPVLAQSASLVGYYGITFLLGAVSAALAIAVRRRNVGFGLFAVALFVVNWSFGTWQLAQPATGSLRVALLASDDLARPFAPADREAARRIFGEYAAAIERLGATRPAIVIGPENVLQLAPAWREDALRPLARAASRAGAMLIIGVDAPSGGARRNVALVLAPDAAPVAYAKRRLIPGLETAIFRSGTNGLTLPGGALVAICKDMDFQAMIRRDAVAGRPLLLAVPGWDFGADGWFHARVAMLRSIENGVPMARSARAGMLTLSDRHGRLVASAPSESGMTVLIGDLPLHGRGGDTPYSKIGDLFGFLGLLIGGALTAAALVARPARNWEPARPA